jgi:hypothetical protein
LQVWAAFAAPQWSWAMIVGWIVCLVISLFWGSRAAGFPGTVLSPHFPLIPTVLFMIEMVLFVGELRKQNKVVVDQSRGLMEVGSAHCIEE